MADTTTSQDTATTETQTMTLEDAKRMVAEDAAQRAAEEAAKREAYAAPVREVIADPAWASIRNKMTAIRDTYANDDRLAIHVNALADIMPRIEQAASLL